MKAKAEGPTIQMLAKDQMLERLEKDIPGLGCTRGTITLVGTHAGPRARLGRRQ